MRIKRRDFIITDKIVLSSISSDVYKLIHADTGMEVIYLKNSDKNKVFCASFKTPPFDNSGTPHIVEHSVLCGSQKYRAKDLFNELMKGSVNTFLNAMTYPDKTIYPFASINDKDFFNLLDVYLDSVFNPIIREHPEFFRQEGWNYGIGKKSSPVELRGIVYNEMKGAYDNPERRLIKKIDEALFKNTPYEYDSGGVPEFIPSLTFERFIKFYDDYYSPSNCMLYLYGDLDINRALDTVSDAVSGRSKTAAPNINLKPLFDKSAGTEPETAFYSVNEENDDGSYFALSYPACDYLDYKKSSALEMLNYILAGNDAAPLRKAMRESGICGDFSAYYRTSSYQTSFSFVGKKCKNNRFDEFEARVRRTLVELSEKGIDKEIIAAALNKWEFFINEEDYGSRTKGLYLGVLAAAAWVYDGDLKAALSVKETFSEICADAYNGLFERLLNEYLINSDNAVRTVLKPKKGLLQAEQGELKNKLAKFKERLTETELRELIRASRALDSFRKKPTPKRFLYGIPSLRPSDINPEVPKLEYTRDENGVYSTHDKAGIDYINLYFDLSGLPFELIPYCGLLRDVLGKTDTAAYSAEQIINGLNTSAGGVKYTADTLQRPGSSYIPRFAIRIKTLDKNAGTVLGLISEVIAPKLDDASIERIVKETLLKMEANFLSNGHAVSIARALSYIFPAANYTDMLSGIGYYDELRGKTTEEITAGLRKAVNAVFRRENLFVGLGSDGINSYAAKEVSAFRQALRSGEKKEAVLIGANQSRGEGLIFDGGVCFNAMAYNLYDAADRYSGKLQVAKAVLNLDFLWPEIRNRRGAYGCGSSFNRDGSVYFYSYRDPELARTFKTFENSFEMLAGYKAGRKELARYIINAIKPFEKPLKPHEALEMSVSNCLLGITDEMRRVERDEILSAATEDVNNIGATLQNLRGRGARCAIGDKSIIESENIFADTRILRGERRK